MTEYEEGDWVSIRTQIKHIRKRVDSDDKILTVARFWENFRTGEQMPMHFDISIDQIDRKIPPPIPPEPSRNAILRGNSGRLYTYRSLMDASSDGWTELSSGQSFKWGREFWQARGPFDIYLPERKA
jgi:hypothetical protein